MGAPPILRRLKARARSRGRLTLGRGVRLGPDIQIDVAKNAHVTIGDGVALGGACRLHVHAGTVEIGAGTRLGEHCVITAHDRVEIGERCRIADGVVLVDFDHGASDPETPVREQGIVTAPVKVGDDAVLDRGACLLRGATVAPGDRVPPHAVVTRSGPAQLAASPTGQLTPVPPSPQ